MTGQDHLRSQWKYGELEQGLGFITVLWAAALFFAPTPLDLPVGIAGGALVAVWIQLAYCRLTEPRVCIRGAEKLASSTAEVAHWGIRISQVTKPSWLPGQSPAWKTRVILAVPNRPGQSLFGQVTARWTGGPQLFDPIAIPLADGSGRTVIEYLPSPALAAVGENFSVYQGHDELIDAVMKIEDDDDCYMFSNASYAHRGSRFRKPEWRIPHGTWCLIGAVHYGDDIVQARFTIRNAGTAAPDLAIEAA